MAYEDFTELPVWQDAIELGRLVFIVTGDSCFGEFGDAADQMQRAAISVSNNIAEGFERATVPELLQFLYIAKGSAGEVRSMCYLVLTLEEFQHQAEEIVEIRELAASLCRQLGAWARSQRDGPVSGHRTLSRPDRDEQERQTKWDEWVARGRSAQQKSIRRTRQAREDGSR